MGCGSSAAAYKKLEEKKSEAELRDCSELAGKSIAYEAATAGGVRVMNWNLMSSAFASNPFEFKPAADYLDKGDQDILNKLLELANKWISPQDGSTDGSPKLIDLLGEDFLRDDSKVTVLEREAITIIKDTELKGLGEWLRSRSERWPENWKGKPIDEVKKLYLEKYEERWNFWKNQTVHEFLCEDYSGGNANPKFPVTEPTFDASCWSLGLGKADRYLSDGPHRRRRAWWLALGKNSDADAAEEIAGGMHDFFKLLVFDLINNRMFEECGLDDCKHLAKKLIPESFQTRIEQITKVVKDKADVAILHEIPFRQDLDMFHDDFYEVRRRPPSNDQRSGDFGSAIIVRKSKFREPLMADADEFFDGEGNADYRMVGCKLQIEAEDIKVHVLGLHLPSRGKSIDENVAKQVEAAIHPNTIAIAGDFNIDFRSNEKAFRSMEKFPKFLEFLQQAKGMDKDLASTCKERLPFQAQITKAFKKDIAMKDYILLGEGLHGHFEVEGYVDQHTRLPSAHVPSDHAPLCVDFGKARS
eukprot:TRINITY_DN76848_c0_g1_i1.p1 TRINITY_DN76848_c0_g1~~TRINITY_DN76848_c0_g1_i1.p1  ORF type:complete len:542 (-),score=118.17 TRINITY_DN76848_c0_g1_i1:225-1811(-)